jgi:hypothetical protein
MKKYYKAALLICVCLLLNACIPLLVGVPVGLTISAMDPAKATGPTYSGLRDTLPPPSSGYGRLYIYRPTSVQWCCQALVLVDGKPVGYVNHTGFIFADVLSGSHEIAWEGNPDKATIRLDQGDTRYVRLNFRCSSLALATFEGCGWDTEPVGREIGETEIRNCKLTRQGED